MLYPTPEGAATVKTASFRAALNYTNIFIFDSKGRQSAFIDKELAELDLSARLPLAGGKIEIGAEAPFYYSSAGFMDGAIRWLHGRVGVPGYSAQAVIPDYTYSDEIRHDGKLIMSGSEEVFSLGDAGFWIKAELFSGKAITVAVQGLAQAPTGDADRGTGSGVWEFGARALVSVAAQKSALHFGGGALMPGMIKRSAENTTLNRMFAGFVAYEYFISDRFRLLAQSMFNSSPFEKADLERFRKRWVEATVGFKYKLKNGSIMAVGLSENLNESAPDFTFHISLEM